MGLGYDRDSVLFLLSDLVAWHQTQVPGNTLYPVCSYKTSWLIAVFRKTKSWKQCCQIMQSRVLLLCKSDNSNTFSKVRVSAIFFFFLIRDQFLELDKTPQINCVWHYSSCDLQEQRLVLASSPKFTFPPLQRWLHTVLTVQSWLRTRISQQESC